MKKKGSWILFVLSVMVFVALRLLAGKKGAPEATQPTKPTLPEPVAVLTNPLSLLPLERTNPAASHHFASLLSHAWIEAQPHVNEVNIEMVRDLAALQQFCAQVCSQKVSFSSEEVEDAVMQTLLALQQQVPFALPDDRYNVICIGDTPPDWVEAPVPFHVYKRLYLGESALGFPFYLDVRVFEPGEFPVADVVAWHLKTLDGEPKLLFRGEKRSIYTVKGERTRETAHGFAGGARGLFLDCIEEGERLYVLYAEAPLETFQEQKRVFKHLVQKAKDEKVDGCFTADASVIWE